MKPKALARCGLSIVLLTGTLTACSTPEADVSGTWNPRTAAAYLDQRADWWMGWQPAARDHGTFCISCHTALPYALSRVAIREVLQVDTLSNNERRLLDNVIRRVQLWKEVGPYYNDRASGADKTLESRGTEAVLNALILAHDDAQNERLSEDARTALDDMWELQQTAGDRAGAWPWLQFGLEPWEGKDSRYYGAALAALAVGTAPETYRSTPAIQSHLELLRAYLDREYSRQPLSNRVVLLWASTKLSGLLEKERKQALVEEIRGEQQPDGGWSLSSLASSPNASILPAHVRSWIRSNESDGYATGLVTFALLEANVPRETVEIQRALSWLMRHQNKTEGFWPARSLNKARDPRSDIGRFMSDAATAYAVLALARANPAPGKP